MNNTIQMLIAQIDAVLRLLHSHMKACGAQDRGQWEERINSCLDERNRLCNLQKESETC
jgi:hypothetical protein